MTVMVRGDNATTPNLVVVLAEAARTAQTFDLLIVDEFTDVRVDVEFASTPLPELGAERPPLRVADLGWSREYAAKIRAQLAAFEEDWDAPGMDAYDAL